jgi:hypothetical protein
MRGAALAAIKQNFFRLSKKRSLIYQTAYRGKTKKGR